LLHFLLLLGVLAVATLAAVDTGTARKILVKEEKAEQYVMLTCHLHVPTLLRVEDMPNGSIHGKLVI
jgi:hypothetical protein